MPRLVLGLAMVLLACGVLPAAAQQPGSSKQETADRSVTGSVKSVTDKGLVVVGHEQGEKDREWAFALDEHSRVENLRPGDQVVVVYADRDGKVVAQKVTRRAP